MSVVKTEAIEVTAEKLAEVLKDNGVIGIFLEPDMNYYDTREFVGMVRRHATDPIDIRNDLEITYRNTGVRILVESAVNKAGEAYITSVTAFDHPWVNPKVDYKKLDAELKAVITVH